MLQKTADKFLRGQRAAFEGSRAVRLEEVGDFFTIKTHNAAVADRHSKDIRCQILESSHSFSNLLAVHHPVLFPNPGGDIFKTVFFLQRVAEFGPKDLRQRFHWKQEVIPDGQPFPIATQSTSGDQVVQMRMVGQISPPGVQYPNHANLPPNKFGVKSQTFGSCCGSMKESFVEQALLAAGQDSEFVRQSESQQEIRDRKKEIGLFFQPFLTFPPLTFRAMPVAAGMILILDPITFRAGIDMPSKSDGAAANHIPHHLQVAGQHSFIILGSILISLQLEDISQFYHVRSFRIALMASTAGDWAFWVI